MDLFEIMSKRRSVRRFSDKPIPETVLSKLFEAVRRSPSWANKQCWRFILVMDAESRARLSELSWDEAFFSSLGYKANPAKKGLAEAPVVAVACADPSESGQLRGQDYYMTDMGIAAETLMLASHALGLGTVFVGIYNEAGIKELLGIPEKVRVVGLFPLGYPLDDKPGSTTRKPVEELLYFERWP